MHSLEQAVLDNLRRQNLAASGDKGIVAVSGGADSLALLLLLHAMRGKLKLRLEVLHFNHGLRQESPEEASWVAEQAAELGLPFHLRETAELKARKAGVQEAARDWRRGESARLLEEIGAQWVATGHHLDDQTETILLKLLRGSHLENLRGMAWKSSLFVRPLLNLTHAELTGYLRERGAAWLEDPSNKSRDYTRNRVRNELAPLMNELSGGGISRHLGGVAKQSEALQQLLASLSPPDQSAPGEHPHWISVDDLMRLPDMAATTALRAFILWRMPGALHHKNLRKSVEMLRSERTAWTLHLSNGRSLRRAGERLLLETRLEDEKTRVLNHGGMRIEYPAAMRIHICEKPCDAEEALVLHNLPAGAELLARHRKNGDRFNPSWRESPVKVKDFLRDQHVPLWRRDDMPCIVLEGKVIGIYPGFAGLGFETPREQGSALCLHFTRR